MPRPVRLGFRGTRLWEEERGDTLIGVRRAVLEEACRLADRLDRLDAIVNGRDRAWLTLELDTEGQLVLSVDKLLSETRQQQLALKQLAAELRQTADTAPAGTGGDVFDQLAARRQARRTTAAG